MTLFDTTTEFGRRVARELESEMVVWLTTVSPGGTPLPVPVWFHWTGDEFVLVSKPDQAKLRNITANPRVALSFNSDFQAEGYTRFTGTARLDIPHTAAELDAYAAKYADRIPAIGFPDAGAYFAAYSEPMRVTPERLTGF